jgi:hypothetical protein
VARSVRDRLASAAVAAGGNPEAAVPVISPFGGTT